MMSRSSIAFSIGASTLACTLVGCFAGGGDVDDESAHLGKAEQAEVVSCPVSTAGINYSREIVITATDVVNDPCRTGWTPGVCANASHVNRWTFGYLIQQIAGTSVNPSTFVLKWLESFEETPVVNGQTLPARSKIRTEIINPWRAASGCSTAGNPKVDVSPCSLDMTKAPFRLLAIVNRTDLRAGTGPVGGYTGGSAGEARFIFGFTKTDGTALNATVILEYKLPTTSWVPQTWAQQFHALGTKTAGETYNSALTTITEMFAKANLDPASPNGSAISQVRTNESAFDGGASPVLELREQRMQCRPGVSCGSNDKYLLPSTLVLTPQNSIDFSSTITDYMNNNMTTILGGTNTIPTSMLAAVSRPIDLSVNPFGVWAADGPLNSVPPPDTEGDVRRLFGIATCNGCHSVGETNTAQFHIAPRSGSVASTLSPFLAGPTTVVEPLEGESVNYNEALRRKCELQWLLNGNSTLISNTAGRSH